MSNLQVAGDIARNFVEEWGCQLEFSFSSKEKIIQSLERPIDR